MQNLKKEIGECECCPATDVEITTRYGNLKMCDECWEKDQRLTKENMTPEKQAERVDTQNLKLIEAREIDNSINVRTDIFNAATVAIMELKSVIDKDDNITNKPYALAELLKNRFEHFKTVIFDASETIVEAGNQQKAIQVYLNNLANSLRAEEREKLKISDISYQPAKPKSLTPKPIKVSGTKSKKLDKAELRKYASELGVSDFTLQMICVQKGITPETAANMLRKSINEAKSE